MKRHRKKQDERWFEKLDAIATGREMPTSEDDDLLHVAAKLAEALTSFARTETGDVQNIYNGQASQQKAYRPSGRRHEKKGSWRQVLLPVAMVLFVLFGIVSACPANAQMAQVTREAGQHLWQSATAFTQLDTSSLALLIVKQAGVRPLLPVAVPAETQAVEFGIVLNDEMNPPVFRAFISDYRIAGQDVSIYEQAANMFVPSSAAQTVSVGPYAGHLFQDDAGNHILQWYQDGMTCQMASTLPTGELLALARQFHPVTRWQLLI